MNVIRRWLPWFTNRYLLLGVFALGWMLFFDKYDLISQYGLRRRTAKLQEDRQYYERQIVRLRDEKQSMRNSAQAIERIAREKYLMKRPNEDLYLVVDAPASTKHETRKNQ